MGQTLSEPITDKTSTHESNNKYFYGCSQMQGWRLTMEDAHTTLLKLGNTNFSFFGVYDGHGGSTIAHYTGQTLYKKVLESEYFAKKEYQKALTDAFLQLDKSLIEDNNFAYDPSGCTAVTALVTDENEIIVANAGDSRAVISVGGKVKPLSYDHKPTDETEMERIINAGGYVEFGRVNGNLALSRAIGDFEFKQSEDLPAEKQVVTCDPDIITHKITQDDEFFVLACDGIWDCMTNQEVVDFVREGVIKDKSLETICEEMMDHCLADSSNSSGLGYDNMSVMVIGILNGKTEKEWYESIKHGRSSTITAPTTNTTTVTNDNSTTATPVITSNSTNTPVAQKETTATTTTTTTTKE